MLNFIRSTFSITRDIKVLLELLLYCYSNGKYSDYMSFCPYTNILIKRSIITSKERNKLLKHLFKYNYYNLDGNYKSNTHNKWWFSRQQRIDVIKQAIEDLINY